MKTIGTLKKGSTAKLNFSGIEIIGTLHFRNDERFTFIFLITDPFSKINRLQSFIKTDIIKIY